MRSYYVYILASRRKVLYVGVTNDLIARLDQHRRGKFGSFTTRYRINQLVFVETTNDVRAAIAREKQLKSWRRERKLSLIATINPEFRDLSLDF